MDATISVASLYFLIGSLRFTRQKRRRKGHVGAAAMFTSQKPPGSAGGLKPTSRLPSVGFEMWQTLRMTVGEWVRTTDAVV